MKELLLLYRVKGWRNKLSCLRFMVYPFLGFSLSPFRILPAAADALAVLGGSMSAYALNDYFDFRLGGEDNFSSRMARKKGERTTLALTLLPLLLLPLGLLTTIPTLFLLLLLLLLTLAYSAPPLRLKERKWGFLIPPLCSPLLVLQAHLALSPSPSQRLLLLLPLLFLFQLQMEVLHRLSEGKGGMRLLRVLPLFHLFLSSLLSLEDPFFLIGSLSSGVRLLAAGRTATEITELRRKVWRPEVFAEELALYTIAGLLL